jgi:hypothetical protein
MKILHKRGHLKFLGICLLAGASWVQAGYYFESKTTGEGQGAQTQSMVAKGWVSGENMKVLLEASGNPMAPSGSYLLSHDAGKTTYLVNPKEKTYAKWDMDALMGMVGAVGSMIKWEFSDIKVEKLAEGPGEPVAGIPTQYYKFRTTYRQKVQILMMKQDAQVEKIDEIWAAPQLVEKALGVYLRKTPPKTGNESFDKFVAMEFAKVQGIPLKMRSVTTTKDSKGKTDTQVVTMEVTTFQSLPVPDSTFALPADYKEVELFPGAGDGDNPMSKLFGGKKGS